MAQKSTGVRFPLKLILNEGFHYPFDLSVSPGTDLVPTPNLGPPYSAK